MGRGTPHPIGGLEERRKLSRGVWEEKTIWWQQIWYFLTFFL